MKPLTLFFCTFSVLLAARAEPPARRINAPPRDPAPRLSILSIAEVTRAALENNASIKAARFKWVMMKKRVPQAAAWEDPRVEAVSLVKRFIDIPPNAFADQMLSLEQEIPISGKNRSRARAATAEAGATYGELRRTELDVVSRARAASHRLADAYAQLEVNRRNELLLSQFAKISLAKYEVGGQTQADVLTAETDTVKLVEQRVDILRQISEQQSALNVLMNRPAQAPLGAPLPLEFQAFSDSLERLQARAVALRPELQRAQSRVDAERARLELANRQWIPDPTLSVRAQRYNQASQAASEVAVGVSFALPWLNPQKYSAGVAEAQNSLAMAEREYDAARAEALGLVRDQLKKIETFAHHYELYRDKLLPLARQTVQANQAGYEADTAGFLALITAQRVLRDVEATSYNHLADYFISIAELEAIVGTAPPRARIPESKPMPRTRPAFRARDSKEKSK